MKTRPILWIPESVRALLNTSPAGKPIDPEKPIKTLTRRLMKPQPAVTARLGGGVLRSPEGRWIPPRGHPKAWYNTFADGQRWKPPAYVEDHLWGREAFTFDAGFNHLPPRLVHEGEAVHYLADNPDGPVGRYRNARFMPRWCSRLLHQVVSVRPESLQEITAEDALAEGIAPPQPGQEQDPATVYAGIWDRLHPENLWSSDPWVWRVEIKRIEHAQA